MAPDYCAARLGAVGRIRTREAEKSHLLGKNRDRPSLETVGRVVGEGALPDAAAPCYKHESASDRAVRTMRRDSAGDWQFAAARRPMRGTRRSTMQETAVAQPAPEVDPIVAESEGAESSAVEAPPELAFTDAASATRWVRGLPLSSVSQAYQEILGQLHALTASTIGPRDRATIAELIREPVAHLHAELARRYAGKPQPLDERESEAADQAIALWEALWIQYSVCLKPLLEGSTELK